MLEHVESLFTVCVTSGGSIETEVYGNKSFCPIFSLFGQTNIIYKRVKDPDYSQRIKEYDT